MFVSGNLIARSPVARIADESIASHATSTPPLGGEDSVMSLEHSINLGAIILSAASLVVAVFALRRASYAEKRALAEAKTNAFLTFRQRFQMIKRDLPPKWNDEAWLPEPDTDEWRRIELYWQNAFDEWFVPMRLNKEHLQDVWELFFESTVASALYNRPLRYVAWHLYTQGEFGKYQAEFAEVLEKLWRHPLNSDF
ncbi:MAG: hypothetical protein ND895_28905 [Pyrinomonadaceae bacterium]|nr:hypothetical protein [Pyrinomonadaceae bacterium]